MMLETSRVRLVPLLEQDHDELAALEQQPRHLATYRQRGRVVSPAAFSERLWSNTLCQMAVRRPLPDGRLLGVVAAYDGNMRNGSAWIAVAISPDRTGTSDAGEALALFLEFVFNNWPVRVLYAQLPSYNESCFSSGLDRYFTKVGCLAKHELLMGELWDHSLVAVTAQQWSRVGTPMARRLRTGPARGMQRAGFEETIRGLADHIGVDAESVDPAAPLDTLGLDSLQIIEALVWLEDRLGLELEADSTMTIDGLLRTLR